MRDNGIPTVVWLSPILPYINDTEENLRGILKYCFEAGVKGIICFGMGMTLREGSREHFYVRLDEHFPTLREKYTQRYGNAYEVGCDDEARLYGIFKEECISHGVMHDPDEVFGYLAEFPQEDGQLSLL